MCHFAKFEKVTHLMVLQFGLCADYMKMAIIGSIFDATIGGCVTMIFITLSKSIYMRSAALYSTVGLAIVRESQTWKAYYGRHLTDFTVI